MTRNRIPLAGTAIALFLAVGVIVLQRQGSDPRTTKVTLATSKNLWCTLPLIADTNGYFKEEGLVVDVRYLDAGRYCMDAIISNSAEFGTVVEVNIAYLGFTNNRDVSITGIVVTSDSSAIVARKSSGISKPEDLRGKKLAISKGTTSDIFAHRFLTKYGMTFKDVNIQAIQPNAMPAAIVSGGVDAGSTWQPFVAQIEKGLDGDSLVFKDSQAYTGYMLLGVRRGWAKENPETVKAFMRALRKAEMFVTANPQQAQQILSQHINLDIGIIRAMWYEHRIGLQWDSGELLKAIRSEGELISTTPTEHQGVPVPDYSHYLDGTFITDLDKTKN